MCPFNCVALHLPKSVNLYLFYDSITRIIAMPSFSYHVQQNFPTTEFYCQSTPLLRTSFYNNFFHTITRQPFTLPVLPCPLIISHHSSTLNIVLLQFPSHRATLTTMTALSFRSTLHPPPHSHSHNVTS